MMMERSKLGTMLRDARRKQGYKLSAVADEVGLRGPSFLSRIETGKDLPPKRLAGRLAQVLGLTESVMIQAMVEANAERFKRDLTLGEF